VTARRPAAPPARLLPLIPNLLLASLLSVGALGGCASPGWYAQAVSGHTRLMRSREPVSEYLENASDDDLLASRLATANELLLFAEQQLGLDRGNAYRSLALTGGEAATWNVVTTPAYDLQPKRWCFLFAGCVPYRGYFDKTDAERFAERMRHRGRDATVAPAAAYSTLGWFEDPILDTMIDVPDADLADTLFHELAHRTLYITGSSTFNESYATFVAREGVRSWLETQGRTDDFAAWSQRQSSRADFMALLTGTRIRLAELYATERDLNALQAGKQSIFEELKRKYDVLVTTNWSGQDRFHGWFDPPPNNADLALISTYTGGLCAFEALWAEAGRDFRRFQYVARIKSEMPGADRDRWLATPCPASPETVH
jgi:predicted aminopeptidase